MQPAGYIDAAHPAHRHLRTGYADTPTESIIYNKEKKDMQQNIEKNVRHCGCCHRPLPVEAFYIDKRTQLPDNYCKECRRSFSHNRYRSSQDTKAGEEERQQACRYPVITRLADRPFRLLLILHAKQVVRESVERKRKRLKENPSSRPSTLNTSILWQE